MIQIPLNEFQTLKSEVRHGFAYVNARLDSIDIEFSKVRTEIRTQGEDLRAEIKAQGDELRAEMKAQGDELRAEMKAQGDELRAEMKVQGDELRSEMKVQGDELRAYINDGIDTVMNGINIIYEKLKHDIDSLRESMT